MVIAVFASSAMTAFGEDVRRLGRYLGEAGHSLIFGGCDNGLMHEIAEGFAQAGAEITGVVPGFFTDRHVHPACRTVIRSEGLSDRKARMNEMADVFLIIPGGIGTMDELFTVLAEMSVRTFAKPVLLYSPDGFYDSLLQMLRDMYRYGAVHSEPEDIIRCASTPEDILRILGEFCRE